MLFGRAAFSTKKGVFCKKKTNSITVFQKPEGQKIGENWRPRPNAARVSRSNVELVVGDRLLEAERLVGRRQSGDQEPLEQELVDELAQLLADQTADEPLAHRQRREDLQPDSDR